MRVMEAVTVSKPDNPGLLLLQISVLPGLPWVGSRIQGFSAFLPTA